MFTSDHKEPRQVYNVVSLPILQGARLSIMQVSGEYHINITWVLRKYQSESAWCELSLTPLWTCLKTREMHSCKNFIVTFNMHRNPWFIIQPESDNKHPKSQNRRELLFHPTCCLWKTCLVNMALTCIDKQSNLIQNGRTASVFPLC
jgi:hypothetical protein